MSGKTPRNRLLPFRLLMLPLVVGSCSMESGDRPLEALYSFSLDTLATKGPDGGRVEEREPLGRALQVRAGPEGTEFPLPGPEDGIPWAEAAYLVFDVWHEMEHNAGVSLHFFREGREEPQIRARLGALPHLQTRMVFPLQALDGQTIFLPKDPVRLRGVVFGHRLPQELISQVTLGLIPAPGDQRVWISNVHLSRERPADFPQGGPVVDELGQWAVKDWPDKARDEAELKARLWDLHEKVKEASFPAEWSRYGGWKARSFRATGFFRTEHDGKRWWLVDPEGYAFYSAGVDGVRPFSHGPVEGMEDLFKWLPPRDGALAEAYSARGVSFVTANLIRVFGEEWRERWTELARGLLVQGRFNTVANWSDLDFAQKARLPYVIPLQGFPTTHVRLYRDFPDVFDPAYEEAAERYARQLERFRDDPYLIGYFLTNEPHWAFGRNNVASEMLATPTPSSTREELVRWLRERYEGDVTALARAWKGSFDSFEELESRPIFDAASLSPQAEEDLWEFSGIMVERYIGVVSEAVKRVDPNHLNLGVRYASISSDLCYRAGRYFDVFSINSYRIEPPAETIAEIARRTGRPVMIGEFHFGALDRGLPSTGLRAVANQDERGVAYRYYVERGARLPDLVGTHYFIWNDQPVLGRFDGENYNIGLVDTCHLPYGELAEAARRTHERIYRVAAGELPPVERVPEEITRTGF